MLVSDENASDTNVLGECSFFPVVHVNENNSIFFRQYIALNFFSRIATHGYTPSLYLFLKRVKFPPKFLVWSPIFWFGPSYIIDR